MAEEEFVSVLDFSGFKPLAGFNVETCRLCIKLAEMLQQSVSSLWQREKEKKQL